jgi:hypothetical protein
LRAEIGPHSRRRIPTLAFTKTQDIGWHVNYRGPQTGVPRPHRFGLIEAKEASRLYTTWLGEHLRGALHRGGQTNGKLLSLEIDYPPLIGAFRWVFGSLKAAVEAKIWLRDTD